MAFANGRGALTGPVREILLGLCDPLSAGTSCPAIPALSLGATQDRRQA